MPHWLPSRQKTSSAGISRFFQRGSPVIVKLDQITVFLLFPCEKWSISSPVKISKSTGLLGRDVLILGIDTDIDRSTTTLGYVMLWLGGTHKGCQASSSKLDRTRREGGRSSVVVRSPNLKNYIWLCFHLFKSISMSLWSFWFYGQSTDN